jgi:hypothetical protein
MRIVFLDIDGVLNNQLWAQEIGGYGHGTSRDGEPTVKSLKWDPNAVAALRKAIDATGAKIVISSSWRGYGKEAVRKWQEMFAVYGWPEAPVIGETPDLTRQLGKSDIYVSVKRGQEVEAWLAGHPEPVEAFVCVDDDQDFLEGQPLAGIDNRYGMQWHDANRIINILLGGSA